MSMFHQRTKLSLKTTGAKKTTDQHKQKQKEGKQQDTRATTAQENTPTEMEHSCNSGETCRKWKFRDKHSP